MIFKSIKLKNFRQYKNEIKFDFSRPSEHKNNITIMIAANGVGKTTLLQAFRYCFYGKSSNYLNLPSPTELINNTVSDELTDLDETNMVVEVVFEHDGEEYIAQRETKFYKTKGILKEKDKEAFILTQETENSGFKPFSEAEANDKIRSILPEGLSQVFMFDGERMERNISDKEFSNELKESILGILDIKKYDKLIEIIGSTTKKTSVLGILSSKKQTSTEEERRNKNTFDKYMEDKDTVEHLITRLTEEKEELEKEININKEEQVKLEINKERSIERNKLEDEIEKNKEKITDLSRKYIRESKQALIYKLLLQNKKKYDRYLNNGLEKENFYAYLHVDTLEDIQNKKICVCGRPIEEHSKEFDRLEMLKKISLPVESSQFLNLIDQKFKQCAGFNEELNSLRKIREEIVILLNENKEYEDKAHKLTQEIIQVERELGISSQEKIDELIELRDIKIKELGKNDERLSALNNAIKKLSRKIENIDKDNEYNQKVNDVIAIIEDMKVELQEKKDELDNEAREVLSKNFNKLLSKTINGEYDIKIDSKYQIEIIDKINNKNVTNKLNTGHNVVISLTFISALIQTAKELSKKINKDQKYGVLMDAALSNLDENHIERLCRNTLNNLDQLIFLSFKRQLRDEMYMGIKDNIGIAYEIIKNPKGEVYKREIKLEDLSNYIHTSEE